MLIPKGICMRRILLWVVGIILVAALILVIAFRLSPWPGAWIIQQAFSQGDNAAMTRLEKHVPPGIVTQSDLTYGPGPDDRFDLSLPPGATEALPVIVWIHGGAWIAGAKEGVTEYLRVLSGSGFATVAVEYSTGWGATYPTAVNQVNDALGHLSENAATLGIDPQRIILAGDSAGAQLAAQVALIVTDPDYARQIGIAPRITAAQLKGTILTSGGYDMQSIDFDGDWAWFLNTVLWAYTGTRDFLDDPSFKLASVEQYVGPGFPPTYITSGNGDPLEPQARRLATTLDRLGVPVSSLFFPQDHEPQLPHEYQFNLDIAEGQEAFDGIVAFARARFAE